MNFRLILCILSLGSASVFETADAPPTFQVKWGSFGSGPSQFEFPYDVKSDGDGNIYVADTGNSRVQKFTNNGLYIGELDSAPSGPAAFGQAGSCAVDAVGQLYVVDARGFIDVFDSNFNFLRNWTAKASYLALDPTGQFLYATTIPDSIVKFDAASGNRLGAWRYLSPGFYGFAVGPSGNLYISLGSSVAKYSSSGTLLGTWGSFGNGNGQFVGARGVAVDLAEHVYVADGGNARIQSFAPDGTFLSQWGSLGSGNGQFSHELPALAVDPTGNVFVLDNTQQRIQKFVQRITPTRSTTWGYLKSFYR